MQKKNQPDAICKKNNLILDANVIFDLHVAQILGQVFRLDFNFITTDFIERELKSINPVILRSLGLQIVSLTGPQVAQISKLQQEYRQGPSANDLSAFIYARDNKIDLVTRDSGLWQVADNGGVTVHETPMLIQDLKDAGILSPEDAISCLESILRRLPVDRLDWRDIIRAWRKR